MYLRLTQKIQLWAEKGKLTLQIESPITEDVSMETSPLEARRIARALLYPARTKTIPQGPKCPPPRDPSLRRSHGEINSQLREFSGEIRQQRESLLLEAVGACDVQSLPQTAREPSQIVKNPLVAALLPASRRGHDLRAAAGIN